MELIFEMGGELTLAKIEGKKVTFANSATNFQTFVPIDCLKLNQEGILREFPDLKDMSEGDRVTEAIKRFKEKLNLMESENQIKDYVKEELEKYGWRLIRIKRDGFRDVNVK